MVMSTPTREWYSKAAYHCPRLILYYGRLKFRSGLFAKVCC